MKRVLLIASLSERYYYDAFVAECKKENILVGILDPEYHINNNCTIHLEQDGSTISGSIEVVVLGDNSNDTTMFGLHEIDLAWYSRVHRTERVSQMTDYNRRFKWSETLSTLDMFLSVLPCPWVNTREAIEYVETNKLFQQVCAQRTGLHTPQTVVTNRHDKLCTFTRNQNHEHVLLKSMGYTELEETGLDFVYSELFDFAEIAASEQAVAICPVYAQSYIPKQYEYRVMVLGDKVLGCRIDSQSSEKTRVDWRHYDFDNVEDIAENLPAWVQASLIKTLNSMRLSYGAVDMILTPDNEWVFLEVNPNGQWHWIQQLADLPIAKTVATMLKNFQ